MFQKCIDMFSCFFLLDFADFHHEAEFECYSCDFGHFGCLVNLPKLFSEKASFFVPFRCSVLVFTVEISPETRD